jgi:predicted ATPase/DNA-binding winged helix-turn-helix (wHTH) protein
MAVMRVRSFCGRVWVMKVHREYTFGEFRLDEANECLWHNAKPVALRPKAYAVLLYLIANQGRLVTKKQLLDAVWPETFVGDAVLKDCIRQLREALGDQVKSPQYIATAHRRGYRFIAPVLATENAPPSFESPLSASETPESETWRNVLTSRYAHYPSVADPLTSVAMLGREIALTQMRDWLDKALQGERQIVFVTGEAGIGKTTLVEAFLDQTNGGADIQVARGQCLEQYGAGEAYLPLLDGLSRLAREPKRSIVIDSLRNHAPTWLVQMPGLTTPAERAILRKNLLTSTHERMLREIAEAIEALAAEVPLVLVLEDLHWGDYSTLDLISYLARRRHPARLMLVGTYRPVDVILNEHPLKNVKQELQVHRLCYELPLEYLTEPDVAEFLAVRFPGNRFAGELAQMIHKRTEGNPLFIVNVVDYLVAEKTVAEDDGCWKLSVDLGEVELGVPENITNLVEKQIDRLSPSEQHFLEGASVVGMDCSAVAISAGLDEDVMTTEEVCDGLARRHQFLLPAYLAELPDGTLTPRYRFIHALYLDVLYTRVAPTRRSQIHGRIGQRGEAVYGDRVDEIAAELAVHFEQARDWSRALKYLGLAAENAARRFANHEARSLARHGLELLEALPDLPEHSVCEETLQGVLRACG